MGVEYYYVKVYEGIGQPSKYYAEHADGTAYVCTDRERASHFKDRKEAERVASTLSGAKVRTVYTSDGWKAYNPST